MDGKRSVCILKCIICELDLATSILGATTVLMSYSVGAKKMKQFKKLLKMSLAVVTGSVVMMNAPLVLDSGGFARIFTDSVQVMQMMMNF